MRAWIDLDWDEGVELTPELVALALNDAFPGHAIRAQHHRCPYAPNPGLEPKRAISATSIKWCPAETGP